MRKHLICSLFAALMLSLIIIPVFAQTNVPVEVHGYMLNRFYANPDSTSRFVTQRVSLSATGKIAEDKTAYVEIYFHPWVTDLSGTPVVNNAGQNITGEQGRTYLESAYVDMPLAAGKLRVGKGRMLNFGMLPNVPNRKTTQYNILSETFTQDRVQGFQYTQKSGTFDWGASLTDDSRLESRKIGDTPGLDSNPVVKHFAERDDNAELSGRLLFSGRLGWAAPCFKFHLSGATGGLNQTDANFIATTFAGSPAVSTDRTHNKYGVDAMYSKGSFVASGEWYEGNFSFLKISGYSVLAGYEPTGKNARRYYVRYSALNNDQPANANQLTWGNQQWLIGIVQPISKGVWVEMNYERNTSSTGAGSADPKNDILMFEVFTGF